MTKASYIAVVALVLMFGIVALVFVSYSNPNSPVCNAVGNCMSILNTNFALDCRDVVYSFHSFNDDILRPVCNITSNVRSCYCGIVSNFNGANSSNVDRPNTNFTLDCGEHVYSFAYFYNNVYSPACNILEGIWTCNCNKT